MRDDDNKQATPIERKRPIAKSHEEVKENNSFSKSKEVYDFF